MWDIHVSTAQKYMTVVVSNICPTGGGNKAGRSPLTGNSCVERHVHSCKMIWERIENFHGLFFFCQREEFLRPIDSSCSPTRLKAEAASGKKKK